MLLGLKPAAGGEVFLQTALGGGGGLILPGKLPPAHFPGPKWPKVESMEEKLQRALDSRQGANTPATPEWDRGLF